MPFQKRPSLKKYVITETVWAENDYFYMNYDNEKITLSSIYQNLIEHCPW